MPRAYAYGRGVVASEVAAASSVVILGTTALVVLASILERPKTS